jgi:hypothetical protein
MKPDFVVLHRCSRDIFYVGEELEVSARILRRIKDIHEHITPPVDKDEPLSCGPALDYHIMTFDGLPSRLRPIGKRLENEINFVSHGNHLGILYLNSQHSGVQHYTAT